MGKVPVNLNYTLSREGLISCLEQCGITEVVASGKLMKRLKLDLPVRAHQLEDLASKPRLLDKLRAGFLARFNLPRGETGLRQVRGPNVMTGYLGRPDKTADRACEPTGRGAACECATSESRSLRWPVRQ